MKKLLLFILVVLIFNCSSDDSSNDCTKSTWYQDTDADGLGNPNVSVEACYQPNGYVSNSSDPDDTDPDNNSNTTICEKAIDVYTNYIGEDSIEIYWSTEDTGETIPSSWVLEIGVSGFTPGTGSTYNTGSEYYNFTNLQAQTTYDFYIKSKCGASTFGENVGPFTTTTLSACSTPNSAYTSNIEACGFYFGWNGIDENAWEVEYGVSGFTLGTGTIVNTSQTQIHITENITPNTTYEVYVRANCGSDGYSNYTNALVVTTESFPGVSSSFLTGNYVLETLNDGAFTNQLGTDIFGAPQVVTIYQQQNDNIRVFYPGYYPDTFTVDLAFAFMLTNTGLVQVDLNDTYSISCDGGATTSVVLGPSNQDQNYTVCDDSVIEFTFFEAYQGTGGCGVTDHPVTIRLTKQ